jgi:hypothetical protein
MKSVTTKKPDREKGDRSAANLSADRFAVKVKTKCRNANALPRAGDFRSTSTAGTAPGIAGAELYFALDFLFRTRAAFVESTRTDIFLDSVRLALPRPPNLGVKYRPVRNSCQEKNAKCG